MTQVLGQIRAKNLPGQVTVSEWDGKTCTDVIVCPATEIEGAKRTCPASGILASMDGVAAKFHSVHTLPKGLEATPDQVDQRLESAVAECITDLKRAKESGADGVSYRVFGADPAHATPMQYGGFFLERDRDILGQAKQEGFVEALIAPAAETYYDFLTDLPSDLISATGATDSELQEMAGIATAIIAGTEVKRHFNEVKA